MGGALHLAVVVYVHVLVNASMKSLIEVWFVKVQMKTLSNVIHRYK